MKKILLILPLLLYWSCDEPTEEDNTPPTVTITSPQNNSSVSEVVSITCMSSYNEGVEKVEDLVWTEIDTKEHYRRAFDYVYPKLLKIENE